MRERVVDASVHIFFQGNSELYEWLGDPFKARGVPDVEMDWYAAPDSEYDPKIEARTDGYPGADPKQVGRHLFEERGVDIAILHPMTRGTLPDRQLGTAVLSAHNAMLTQRWLDDDVYGERFRGTIRVNPDDVDGALKDIERWADHPRVVQIGLPLQTRELYGKPQFRPIFEEATRRGLPVAVHSETGSGPLHPPTPSGHTRTYAQYAAFTGITYLYHLTNMIAEGVFEAFPDLKVVWADGGADMLTPIMWRMDTLGRPALETTPWAPEIPSSYLRDHVWFVHSKGDGAPDPKFASEWLELTEKTDMLMYGSSYPHWHIEETSELPSGLTDEQREKVLWKNADKLYGLELEAKVAASP
jgi:predicted TIM-barrel fold metal-dependent hydrolase